MTLLSTDQIVERQNGRVRRIVLNRPHKHNAITAEMNGALFACFEDAMKDDDTHVVVLSGAGPSFSSGADHKQEAEPGTEQSHDPTKDTAGDMVLMRRRVEDLLRLWSFPKPTIAQVHGYCFGIANELAACCDLMICGLEAKIGAPEVRVPVAMVPTLSFWPFTIGLQRTKELMFTGRILDGPEAVQLGLALAAVPEAELESYVDNLATRIAEVPRRTLSVAKQAANSWWETLGVRDAAMRGGEFHAIYHTVSEYAPGEMPRLAGNSSESSS